MTTESPHPSPLTTETPLPHWSEGIESWVDALPDPSACLIASDFDGTLSLLVSRADDARLVPGALPVLEKLVHHLPPATVALISGRELSDLATRLVPLNGDVVLAGNHGLEIRDGDFTWTHPEVLSLRPSLESLMHEIIPHLARLPGTYLEDKTLSLTLHYRQLDEAFVPALVDHMKSIEVPDGIEIHEGKQVFEFRPLVSANKGSALRQILDRHHIPDSATLFVGDDTTDEDAFAALDPLAFTLHVGSAHDPSLARFHARDPHDVVEFLDRLHQLLSRRFG